MSSPAVIMGLHLTTGLLPSPSDLNVFVPQGRRIRQGFVFFSMQQLLCFSRPVLLKKDFSNSPPHAQLFS